ncbi:MAG: hypothetical protein STHCBS139747_004161 [Sporothrix thermara]
MLSSPDPSRGLIPPPTQSATPSPPLPSGSTSRHLSPVDDIVASFTFSDDDVRVTAAHLLQQLKTGLLDKTLPFQHPSFVTVIPDGSETGRFLSVDLGGTNCRICLVELLGDGTFAIEQQKHAVPRHVRVNDRYEPLFDWVAARIGDFLQQSAAATAAPSADPGHPPEKADTTPAILALGFTFSFTCTQTSLAAGTLLHWDKGWDIPSALGRDPCALLQAATDAQQLPVRVAALANDSVGSLLTRAYTSTSATSRTLACLIVGTGTNAAYVERLRNVKRLLGQGQGGNDGDADGSHDDGSHDDGDDDNAVTAINTEWGCMDDDMRVLPRTRFDDAIDARSTDCGIQMLEKRVSGLYLGELLRLAVCELYQQHGAAGTGAGAGSGCLDMRAVGDDCALFRCESVDASLLSGLAVEDDAGNDGMAAKIKLVAETLGVENVSAADVRIVQAIANAIAMRAARLIGAATAAIVLQSGLLSPTTSTPVVEKEQTHVATTAIMDVAPVPAPQVSSTSTPAADKNRLSLLSRVRRVLLAPLSSCLGMLRPKKKTEASRLLSASPSPSSPSPSPSPSPSSSKKLSTSSSPSSSSAPFAPASSTGPMIDIGVTGSVIEYHPTFEREMHAAMRQVPGIGAAGDARIRTGLCRDGSAVGAALMVHAALTQEARAKGVGGSVSS